MENWNIKKPILLHLLFEDTLLKKNNFFCFVQYGNKRSLNCFFSKPLFRLWKLKMFPFTIALIFFNNLHFLCIQIYHKQIKTKYRNDITFTSNWRQKVAMKLSNIFKYFNKKYHICDNLESFKLENSFSIQI